MSEKKEPKPRVQCPKCKEEHYKKFEKILIGNYGKCWRCLYDKEMEKKK